ncbi:MAG: aconitate hydratase AcnA [Thermoprotei archaeon]
MSQDFRLSNTLKKLDAGGETYEYYSLPALEEAGLGMISRLPLSIRIILESLVRNCDGVAVSLDDVKALARWNPTQPAEREIPFRVARVIMQDFTGVPAIVDLAAMRQALSSLNVDPKLINPIVPVDLVVDHSIQVDYYAIPDALKRNLEKEFERNSERYRFLKWAQKSFSKFRLFPPGVGIIHQVNLEYLATVVTSESTGSSRLAYFDTLVGTDSHTTMVNGLGVLGWGVGGIEAEAAMLGQPVTLLTPRVVGVNLKGKLRTGVTATDLVLTLAKTLRDHGVVDKIVEFYGEGVRYLSVPDRATVSNMCPEYGATAALFPVDDETLNYLRLTGRSGEQVKLVESYLRAQRMLGVPMDGEIDYSEKIEVDLSKVEPTLAGPALPWQSLSFSEVPSSVDKLVEQVNTQRGMQGSSKKRVKIYLNDQPVELGDGDVVIAAITSCTNTSNPSLMVGAGLLAKKAYESGLRVPPYVKTSFAPGSRVVTDYLVKSGLMGYLDRLGFNLVGYGCTTCIGNSGPLPETVERGIQDNKLVVSSVLSGNRNFEMRIHRSVRANYLMSPPLVVAYALAGSVTKDLSREPIGVGKNGPVYLKDIWPSEDEVKEIIRASIDPDMYRERYSHFEGMVPEWDRLQTPSGDLYSWDPKSTYIRLPPFFEGFKPVEPKLGREIRGARVLLILGDAVTTDHISPAGSIAKDSPAGKYLIDNGVQPSDFNSYGSRRGNHEVMMRGTFDNKGVKNKMVPNREGGYTAHQPDGAVMSVYDAAMRYKSEGVPLIILAGKEYGAGSSRDWAAKGPALLGVKAVIAESYERIHRSNLVGMGVLPLQFLGGENTQSLGLDGSETFDIVVPDNLTPGQTLSINVTKKDGKTFSFTVRIRLDTPMEIEYYRHGGILHYVLRGIMKRGKQVVKV